MGFLLGTLHGYFFQYDFWPNLNIPLEHQINRFLNCNPKVIKSRLEIHYKKLWEDMLHKTSKSFTYHKHKTEIRLESYLTQVAILATEEY